MSWWVLPFSFLFPPCFWWSGSLALVEAVLAPLLDRHDSHGPRLLPSRSSTNNKRRAMSLKSILVSQPKKQMPRKALFWSHIRLTMSLVPRPWSPRCWFEGQGIVHNLHLSTFFFDLFSVCLRWWATKGVEKAIGSTCQVWSIKSLHKAHVWLENT